MLIANIHDVVTAVRTHRGKDGRSRWRQPNDEVVLDLDGEDEVRFIQEGARTVDEFHRWVAS